MMGFWSYNYIDVPCRQLPSYCTPGSRGRSSLDIRIDPLTMACDIPPGFPDSVSIMVYDTRVEVTTLR
jgi:hypothetical protein